MENKRIGFTGHRDRQADPEMLEAIAQLYGEGYTWVHGGATGFDRQVERVAKAHKIPTEVWKPNYESAKNARSAPIIRNKQMIDSGIVLLIACYDGRPTGGTHFTVKYAFERGIKVKQIATREIVYESVSQNEISGPGGYYDKGVR
jgi:hypothetical protein